MKTQRIPRKSLSLLTACTLLAGALGLCAQSEPEKAPNRRPAAQQPNPPRDERLAQRPMAALAGFNNIVGLLRVLTDEQRRSLREAAEADREKLRGLEEQMRDARKEMLTATLAEKFDEKAVREKAQKVAKLEADMLVHRARQLSKVQPPLSPEQIEQIKNPPPMDFQPGEGVRNFRNERLNRDGGENAPRNRPNNPRPPERDENDLPPKPKPDA